MVGMRGGSLWLYGEFGIKSDKKFDASLSPFLSVTMPIGIINTI